MHEVKIHLTIELITLCSPGSERLLMSRSRVKVVPLSLKIKPFYQFSFFNDRLEVIKTMLAVWPGICIKNQEVKWPAPIHGNYTTLKWLILVLSTR